MGAGFGQQSIMRSEAVTGEQDERRTGLSEGVDLGMLENMDEVGTMLNI